MTWLIWVLGGFVCILVFIIYNLLTQVNRLEDVIGGMSNDSEEVAARAINLYNFVLSALTSTLAEFNRVDKKGSFSSDDEVGFSFNVLRESIEHLRAELQRVGGSMENVVEETNGEE